MSKLSLFSWSIKLNKKKLCLYVADPATFPASNSVLELRTSCLFSSGKDKYFWVCVFTFFILLMLKFGVWISSSKLHSAPLSFLRKPVPFNLHSVTLKPTEVQTAVTRKYNTSEGLFFFSSSKRKLQLSLICVSGNKYASCPDVKHPFQTLKNHTKSVN